MSRIEAAGKHVNMYSNLQLQLWNRGLPVNYNPLHLVKPDRLSANSLQAKAVRHFFDPDKQ